MTTAGDTAPSPTFVARAAPGRDESPRTMDRAAIEAAAYQTLCNFTYYTQSGDPVRLGNMLEPMESVNFATTASFDTSTHTGKAAELCRLLVSEALGPRSALLRDVGAQARDLLEGPMYNRIKIYGDASPLLVVAIRRTIEPLIGRGQAAARG